MAVGFEFDSGADIAKGQARILFEDVFGAIARFAEIPYGQSGYARAQADDISERIEAPERAPAVLIQQLRGEKVRRVPIG